MDQNEALRMVYNGGETRTIEYKRSMPWDGEERFKLVKTIAGMANAGGGYLVVGFDEQQVGDERYVGVNESDAVHWDVTDVARDVNNYVQPDIDLEVNHVTDPDRNISFIVVRIPQHGSTPHICSRDFTKHQRSVLKCGALYYRNRNKEVTEIGRIDDWNDLIQRLTLQRREEIRRMFDEVLRTSGTGGNRPLGGSLDLSKQIKPIEEKALGYRTNETTDLPVMIVAAIPTEGPFSFDVTACKDALKAASVDYRGWPYIFYLEDSEVRPHFDQNAIWAVDAKPFYGRSRFNYWRFDYSIGLFFSSQITYESSAGRGSNLDAYFQTNLLTEVVVAIGRLYQGLGVTVDNSVDIMVEYTNLMDANIMIMEHELAARPYAGSRVQVRDSIFLNEMLTRPWSHAAKFVSIVGQRMGARHPLPEELMAALGKKHIAGGKLQQQ